MHIDVNSNNLDFFKCFSSATKLKIIELISLEPQNIGDLARQLDVSSTIITRNIKELESAGIIKTDIEPGIRGQQKLCSLAVGKVTLDFTNKMHEAPQSSTLEIPVGQFTDHSVMPTCGLASIDKYLGMVDDPRYFNSPEHGLASIVWFQTGHVAYTLPSYLFDRPDTIQSITVSMEICSEFPGYNDDYPSDIHFEMNGHFLGLWTSPGNYGNRKGFYTPDWFKCGTEYGLLKNLMINQKGTYIDGKRISDITLHDLELDGTTNQILTISSPKEAAHPGGVTLFGKGFGNYNQDIIVTVNH